MRISASSYWSYCGGFLISKLPYSRSISSGGGSSGVQCPHVLHRIDTRQIRIQCVFLVRQLHITVLVWVRTQSEFERSNELGVYCVYQVSWDGKADVGYRVWWIQDWTCGACVLMTQYRLSCCPLHHTKGQTHLTDTRTLSLYSLLCGSCLVAS